MPSVSTELALSELSHESCLRPVDAQMRKRHHVWFVRYPSAMLVIVRFVLACGRNGTLGGVLTAVRNTAKTSTNDIATSAFGVFVTIGSWIFPILTSLGLLVTGGIVLSVS